MTETTTILRAARRHAATALAGVAAVALLSGCGRETPAMVTVENAWVRLPAVAGNPGAAYLTLHGGRTADRLLGIESPAAARIELHASMEHGGMMTMRPLSGIDVPAATAVTLAPEGQHAMMFDIVSATRPGGTVRLVLRFQSGEIARVPARAVAAGNEAP